MSDPERIWLQSYEDTTALGEDRLWCEDKVWPANDEDHEPTEYIRADRISQQDAELERLRRELEEARAEHQFSLGLVDQAAVKLAETKDALQDIYKAIEREPIVGDLDYPHAHNDWRGWRKKVLRPAAEKARALLGGDHP